MRYSILSILIFLMASCYHRTDGDGMVPEIKYYFVNQSSSIITISVENKKVTANIADSIIQIDDTIQFWDYTFSSAVIGPFGSPEEATVVMLIFEGSQKKCLLYTGTIDTLDDIRSVSSYHDDAWVGNKVNRFFTITDEHYNKGVPCP